MAMISIFASCFCYDSFRRKHNNSATSIAVLVGIGIVILSMAKDVYMITTESAEIIEITIIIISIIIVHNHCVKDDANRCHGIIITLVITIMTAVLETIRNIYATQFYARDGNGCPLL